jgi:hypothetical protein
MLTNEIPNLLFFIFLLISAFIYFENLYVPPTPLLGIIYTNFPCFLMKITGLRQRDHLLMTLRLNFWW